MLMTIVDEDVIIVWRPRQKASQRVRVLLSVPADCSPWRRERHGEETLNFCGKSVFQPYRSFGRRRSWMASLMAPEYEPQSSKRFARSDLTSTMQGSTGEMRALCICWRFVWRQGQGRGGSVKITGYSTLPRRTHFQTCLRPAPVSCIGVSSLMRWTSSHKSPRPSSRHLCSDAFGPESSAGRNR